MKSIAETLDSTTIRQVVNDPRASYRVLRAFHALPQTVVSGFPLDEPRSQEGSGRLSIDIDEAIIENERYIRSRGPEANVDGKYLVSLDDLVNLLAKPPNVMAKPPQKGTPLTIIRKDPPRGGLDFWDEMRKRKVEILPDSSTYSDVFDRITNGILRGLDWTNVFVAGGMALTTLLHTSPWNDDDRSVRDPDIDLYIHGLGPEDANRKAEEVYDIWAANLPAAADKRLVIKNAKTITLLPSYPHRRIQIILKLPVSPTDVLLNFDLDACAIGFDGYRVLMLPRCARAIETGYSVFTMDLVWGHHLGDRRATQGIRVLKYAERGFGLRFLPSYAQSLESDGIQRTNSKLNSGEDERQKSQRVQHQRDRHPHGSQEPGLRTLKRIAYLGADFVHRFTFGPTPLTTFPPQHRNRDESELNAEDEDLDDDLVNRVDNLTSLICPRHWLARSTEDRWETLVREAERALEELKLENAARRVAGETLLGPDLRFSDLDSEKMHHGLPGGRRGLGNFELFTRHSEAWRRHARHEVSLDIDKSSSTVYDTETYDDLPTYYWDGGFDPDHLARQIDDSNDHLFCCVKIATCQNLGIAHQHVGYRNYLTRRIRRQVHGPTFKSVQEKQITIPMILPWELEEYFLDSLPQQYPDLPSHATDFKPLIPAHDPSKYDPATAVLPSMHDTTAGSGNLRYWVITNENLWAGQHRVLDEMAEILWSMFHWFTQIASRTIAGPDPGPVSADHPESVWHLARSCRRRIVLPQVADDQNICEGIRSLREGLLFRKWAFLSPVLVSRERDRSDESVTIHPLFDAHAVQYPFPDHLFWEDGDEGEWSEEGVPPWKDNLAAEGHRNTPAEDFYHPLIASNESFTRARASVRFPTNFDFSFPNRLHPYVGK